MHPGLSEHPLPDWSNSQCQHRPRPGQWRTRMHELSIAHELVALACASAERAGAQRVRTVHVRVGALAGVADDALMLGYEIAASDTSLDGAQLIIEAVPAAIHCGRRPVPGALSHRRISRRIGVFFHDENS